MTQPKPSDIHPRPKKPAIKADQDKAKGEKPKFVRKPHLTQRPFHNPSLVSLRDGLRTQFNIKKG